MFLTSSKETSWQILTAGVAQLTFRMPRAMTLDSDGVRISVKNAPGASGLTVDVNESGVSILSTKATIDSGEFTSLDAATPPVISDVNLADDAEITVDIDAVDGTTPGSGLKLTFRGVAA